MKKHEDFKLLIETQPKVTQGWRIVARHTTPTGLSKNCVLVEERLPDYPTARREFENVKQEFRFA